MSGPVRVAFLIDEIGTATGGTEGHLVRLLERLDRSAVAPILCCLRPTAWLESFRACPVHVLHIGSLLDLGVLKGIFRFSRFLKDQGIQILQVHFRDATMVGLLAAKLAGGIKVVGAKRNQGYWHDTLKRAVDQWVDRRMDHLVVNAESTKDWLVAEAAIPAQRISVVYNGIDLSRFQDARGEREAVRTELGLEPDQTAVCLVANLRPVKRIDVFLRVAGRLATCSRNFRFFIVGDGPLNESLQAEAAGLGLSEAVRFLGRRTDVPRLLQGMDVGVLTSDSESFSNSVVEYMAAGLPVACTNVGGCREALLESRAGLVVPPQDDRSLAEAVIRLCREDVRRWARDNHPRIVAERFAVQGCAHRHEQVYLAVSGGGCGVHPCL